MNFKFKFGMLLLFVTIGFFSAEKDTMEVWVNGTTVETAVR